MENLKIYLKYFKYAVQHKWYVFEECLKEGMYWHGLTHDLSKFLPSEFFPYARYWFGEKNKQTQNDFKKAWLLHQHRNKHHWNYWVKSDGEPVDIPYKYVIQMICDWKGMSRKFGDTAKEFYNDKKDEMVLSPVTKYKIAFFFTQTGKEYVDFITNNK